MVAAYFDCQFGAAGDMLVASLIDAGVDFEEWLANIRKLALPPDSFSVRVEKVMRCTIASTKLHVDVREGSAHLYALQHQEVKGHHHHDHDENAQHSHGLHAHKHVDTHEQQDEGPFDESHTPHPHGRTPEEIKEVINHSAISKNAKELSIRIFERLARAEAKVHGTCIKEVHFHEVGAVDAIVDIVGFAIAYDMLCITESFVSAVPLGKGHVQTAHGLLPIPAPAVVNLLAEANRRSNPVRTN
jgi:pyridinium-3,5-bisthiocarboxylic acid mononucleotide nickel chelatase